jgi:hypothetical protein
VFRSDLTQMVCHLFPFVCVSFFKIISQANFQIQLYNVWSYASFIYLIIYIINI